MTKQMRRLAFLFLFFAIPTLAQRTIVSSTVQDPGGLAYSGASLTATLVLPVGALGAYLNGAQIAGSAGPVQLDSTGSFLMNLADNTQIKCSNAQGQLVTCVPQTQWAFTITATGVAPPVGTGPQTCAQTFTISGTSQILLFSACPLLAKVGGGSQSTYNVKNFGAKGDTQIDEGACSVSVGSPNILCTNNPFKATDVGKRSNCGLALGAGTFFAPGSTIAQFISPSTVALSSNANGTNGALCSWGTVDDSAINQAVTAWLAAVHSRSGQGANFLGPSATPILYFPSGAYLYCGSNNNPMVNTPATFGGGVIQGDAPRQSWLVGCDTPTNSGGLGLGFFINQQSGGSTLVIKNLAFTTALLGGFGASSAMILSGNHTTESLYMSRWNGGPVFASGGSGYNLNLVVDQSSSSGSTGALICNACSDEFHYGGSSNNGAQSNTQVANSFGLNLALGPRFYNWLNDEGNCLIGCFNVTNSSDVWIIGSALFGISGGGLVVDGASFVHTVSSVLGIFGGDLNATSLVIQTGGQLQSSDTRFVSTGTGKCINNSGSLYDNGGNTCETMFQVSTSASTGTAATLTVTTLGANVNTVCSVGDTLLVVGNAVVGYNGFFPFGITSVGTNTIGYTTQGSNIGAGAGGLAFCRNLQTYTGNLPKALLNSPVPNTCYVTGTFAATTSAAPMCTFKLQSATNVSFIKASSTTTTACTVAPVVTISDGTVSQTLTITTAKSIWDSSVDASTGVGTTIFKPNGTITVTNTAGTCTTSPTNFGVSYNVQPILSN